MRLPPLPENVRLTDVVTGESFPVELRYGGRKWERHGRKWRRIHTWIAVSPIALTSPSLSVAADVIPAHTRIDIAIHVPMVLRTAEEVDAALDVVNSMIAGAERRTHWKRSEALVVLVNVVLVGVNMVLGVAVGRWWSFGVGVVCGATTGLLVFGVRARRARAQASLDDLRFQRVMLSTQRAEFE